MKKTLFTLIFAAFVFTGLRAQNTDMDLANEYFANEDYDKALTVYAGLIDKPEHVFTVHDNYLEALLKTEQFDKAQKYLKRRIKKYPDESVFNIDYGLLLVMQKREEKADEHFTAYVARIRTDNDRIRYAARRFINAGLYDYAEMLYKAGRQNGRDDFSYDLAALYGAWGKPALMANEYLAILSRDPARLEFVQSVLGSRLRDSEDFRKVEPVFFRYVQKYPDNVVFNEMLVWLYVQDKNFRKAFFQAKAVDRRKQLQGTDLFHMGTLAVKNKDYKTGIDIFKYITDKYPQGMVYPQAKRSLVSAKEELVKNTYPVDIEQIKSLAADYNQILDELGLMLYTAEAALSMARLHAFYLNNTDTAALVLNRVIAAKGIAPQHIARAKLELGDLYVLKDEPWESALLYGQVEKAMKNTNLGHLAKLRNARLSYFKGDFELAKGHLDILKLATSREIANDAMRLSLLIGDNLELDTTEAPLRNFAAIELLTFQRKTTEALKAYDKMLVDFPGHSLTDEIYFEKSRIFLEQGLFPEAIVELERIMTDYSYDILADNANFMIGKIYQENMNEPDKAMEYFKKHMLTFPGSVFTTEARKRFRLLRGDTTDRVE